MQLLSGEAQSQSRATASPDRSCSLGLGHSSTVHTYIPELKHVVGVDAEVLHFGL